MSAVRIVYILSLCTFASTWSKSSAISPTSPTISSPITTFSSPITTFSSPITTFSSLATQTTLLPTPLSTTTFRTGANRGHLEFYKVVEWAWRRQERPFTKYERTAPEYPWKTYFDNHLKMGIRNFVLGYIDLARSRIQLGGGIYTRREWRKASAFKYLKRNVVAKGGRILVDINYKASYETAFNETAFTEAVAEFVREFPVDGFRIHAEDAQTPWTKPIKFGSVKALLKAIRKLDMISAIWIKPSNWDDIFRRELGGLADINFLSLDIRNDTDIPVFNTDLYAEEILENATNAGMAPDKIVLSVPLAAHGSIPRLGSYGYSSAVLDYRADPEGDGVARVFSIFPEEKNFYYFFSQKRGIDKIHLAGDRGLHGISVEGDRRRKYTDLTPWFPRSLTHALATNV
ncbi:hypothetical protein FOZ60_002935 [Perkinsus olseni]|uniref:Chitinase n=1 Tax=Perkinsus olseni TaxID=32597 RepID=A0A7J6NWM6_PEROL|nr:hypothetical protein FOZ60_002935 [Perkinsus olseni]